MRTWTFNTRWLSVVNIVTISLEDILMFSDVDDLLPRWRRDLHVHVELDRFQFLLVVDVELDWGCRRQADVYGFDWRKVNKWQFLFFLSLLTLIIE